MIALPCNIFIMLSLIVCKKWRQQLFPAKLFLFTIRLEILMFVKFSLLNIFPIHSLFEIFSCGALLLKTHYDDGSVNNDTCRVQALLIQVFERIVLLIFK